MNAENYISPAITSMGCLTNVQNVHCVFLKCFFCRPRSSRQRGVFAESLFPSLCTVKIDPATCSSYFWITHIVHCSHNRQLQLGRYQHVLIRVFLDYFQLWDTHHNPEMIQEELNDSLKDLQVSHIDLYLIHWPMSLQVNEYKCTRKRRLVHKS